MVRSGWREPPAKGKEERKEETAAAAGQNVSEDEKKAAIQWSGALTLSVPLLSHAHPRWTIHHEMGRKEERGRRKVERLTNSLSTPTTLR